MGKILSNRYVQVALALGIGITIGAVFYPTSEIIEETEKRLKIVHKKEMDETIEVHQKGYERLAEINESNVRAYSNYKEETTKTLASNETTISTLRSKISERTYKLIKPDGTIIEKTFKESETEEHNSYVKSVKEEFSRKVSSIESKYKSIHKARVKEVKEESESKYKKLYTEKLDKYIEEHRVVKKTVNPKKFNIEAGYTTDNKFYTHSSYTLWGPITVGGHLDTNKEFNDVSAGVGLGISF